MKTRLALVLAGLAAAVCLALLGRVAEAQSIIAVDPGATFLKVVLVQPGKVFDIALSTDSKRKIFSGFGLSDGMRFFGSESFNLYGKKPHHTVWRVRDLLGRSPKDAQLLKTLEKNHLNPLLIEADDGTGALRIDFAKGTKDEVIFAPEEIFAMILNHCKENAERHGQTRVSSVALTVPNFYNQARRQGVSDASDVAGLTLMNLVDENGAAAIQYAVDRSFNETATNVLLFNMGAASTQVSVVQITGGKEKRSGKEFRNVKVLSKAWDESLGADDFDLVLAQLFAKEFDSKHPSGDGKIMDAPRAVVRLKKEGRAIKEILSGLDKFPASFASLHRDIDFKSQVTRSQMEELGKDILNRVTSPVERALKAAGLGVNDLHLVEVIGGGFRIPGVKDALKKVLGGHDLSTHINGDEGMAFGTAFCAANVSATFRVPRVATFQDALPREIRFQLKGEDLDRDVALFPRFTLVEGKEPVKQVIKFRHDKDFKLVLIEKKAMEDDPAEYPESTPILEADISGMKGALEAFGKFGEPKVHLTFTVDRNLMVTLVSADARFEEEYEEAVKIAATNSTSNSTNATDSTKTEDAAAKPAVEMVKKTRRHVFSLTVKRTDASVPVKKMTPEAKLIGAATLKKYEEEDRKRARRDEARNSLEAYSFASREKLDSHENEVKQVTSSEYLEELKSELSKVEDWIDDNKNAPAEDFAQERARLASKIDKIFYLIKEQAERPVAIKAFRSIIRSLEDRRGNWTQERPWITEKVWEAVDKQQAASWKWIDEMEAAQDKLTAKDEPVLTTNAIRLEMEKIQKMVELLLKQRKPAPILPKVDSTAKKSKSKDGSSDSSTGSEEPAKEDAGSAGGETTSESTGSDDKPKEAPKEEL